METHTVRHITLCLARHLRLHGYTLIHVPGWTHEPPWGTIDGLCVTRRRRIEYTCCPTPALLLRVLLHEGLHALEYTPGPGRNFEESEAYTEAIAPLVWEGWGLSPMPIWDRCERHREEMYGPKYVRNKSNHRNPALVDALVALINSPPPS